MSMPPDCPFSWVIIFQSRSDVVAFPLNPLFPSLLGWRPESSASFSSVIGRSSAFPAPSHPTAHLALGPATLAFHLPACLSCCRTTSPSLCLDGSPCCLPFAWFLFWTLLNAPFPWEVSAECFSLGLLPFSSFTAGRSFPSQPSSVRSGRVHVWFFDSCLSSPPESTLWEQDLNQFRSTLCPTVSDESGSLRQCVDEMN